MGPTTTNQEIARSHPTGFYDQNPIYHPEAIEVYQTGLAHTLMEPAFTPELLVRRANNPTTLTPLHHKDYRGREGIVGLGDAFVINYATFRGVDPKDLADSRYKLLIDKAQDMFLGEIDPFVQAGIRSELLRRVKTVASNKSDEAGYLELLSALKVYEPVDPKYSMSLVKAILLEHYVEHCKQSKPDTRVLKRLATLFAETARNDTRSTPVEIGTSTYRLLTVEKAKPKIADAGWIECVGSRRKEADAKRATELCAPVYDTLKCGPPPTIVYKTGPTKTGKSLIAAKWAAIEAAVAAKKSADKASEVASAVADKAPDVTRTVTVLGLVSTLGFLSIGNPSKAEAATQTVAYTTSALTSAALAERASQSTYTPDMKKAVQKLKALGGHWKNQGMVLEFFLENGMGINASSGIVGSTEAESSTNPTRHQVRGSAYGAFQHDGSRRDRLMRTPGYQNLLVQCKFALNEMVGYGMIDNLRAANSPEQAAEYFEVNFERAGVPRMNVRKAAARAIHNEFERQLRLVQAENAKGHGSPNVHPSTAHPAAPKPAPTPEVPATPSAPAQVSVSLDILNTALNTSPSDANVVTGPQSDAVPAVLVDLIGLGLLQNPDGNNGTTAPDAQKQDVSPPSVVMPNPTAASPTLQQIELTPPAQQPIPSGQANPPAAVEAIPSQQPAAQPASPAQPAAPSPEITAQPDNRNPAAIPLLTTLGALSIDPNSAQATGNGLPDAPTASAETVAPDPSSVAVASTPTPTPTPDVSLAPAETVDISQISITPPAAPAPEATPPAAPATSAAPKVTKQPEANNGNGAKHPTTNGGNVPEKWKGNVYYSQYDKRWAGKKYAAGGDGGTIASSGCGATSLAIVVANLADKNVTPVTIANYNMRHGYKAPRNGTYFSALTAVPQAYGLHASRIGKSVAEIKRITDAGGYVIVNGTDNNPSTPATSEGHIYVIRDVTPTGRLLILDPANFGKTMLSWDPQKDVFNEATIVVGITK